MRLSALVITFAVAAFAAEARAQPADVIALDMSGPRPAVAISIGDGAPELWTFDTGAGGNVMNMDRARALGLPEQGRARMGSPVGGTPVEGFITTLDNAHIGAVAIPSMRVVAAPSTLPNRTGVLSPNAFAGRLVIFDFAHNQVRIADKTPQTIPSAAPTPYSGEGRRVLPAIAVRIGDQPVAAHMDSGNPAGLTLPYAMASSLTLAAAPVQTGVARFVDGEHPRYHAKLIGQVQAGPLTLTDPEIDFIDGLPGVNVGMQLLSRMTITLDPAEQRGWALAN